MRRRAMLIGLVVLAMVASAAPAGAKSHRAEKTDRLNERAFSRYSWTEVNGDAPWAGRAGLEAAALGRTMYVMGGRTPLPPGPIPGASTIWGDVWRSRDLGVTWEQVLATGEAWPARAYHEVVTLGRKMYLLGGQDFGAEPNPACQFDPNCFPPVIPTSEFFNDVWSSSDGVNWELLTDDAPWTGRAGLSAITFRGEIYVMGGSFNDDPDIIGGPPMRELFNDVWKSADGVTWELLTDDAPWDPRAGADLVVKGGYIYLLGGEFGFTGFPPPYFNDVWRTRNGIDWELVTASAGWSPRPGHTCDVLRARIVCFGGFGQSTDPADPFKPSNPMDIWVSRTGKHWTQISGTPWNAAEPGEIKYDYDTVVAPAGPNGRGRAIYTFGGDRETFDFMDPTQYLNVDNDVWVFGRQKRRR